MKTIMLVLALMLGAVEYDTICAQVPDVVLRSFKQQYPQASVKKWKVKNDTCIAEFTMNRSKKMAYYLSDAQLLKTETKIPWTKDLPMAVDNSWKNSVFASWYVANIREVKYSDNRDLYVMRVQQDCGPEGSIPGDCLNVYKLYYNPDGKLVRKVHVE